MNTFFCFSVTLVSSVVLGFLIYYGVNDLIIGICGVCTGIWLMNLMVAIYGD